MILEIFHDSLDKKQKVKLEKFLRGGTRFRHTRFRHIGDGTFAEVFSLSRDTVVRVEKFDENSGYNKYVSKFVLKNKSKYLPKIYFHGKCDMDCPVRHSEAGPYLVTVIEKLKIDVVFANEIDLSVCEGEDSFTSKKYSKIVTPRKLSNIRNLVEKMKACGLDAGDAGWENILFRKCKKTKTLIPVYTDPCYH